MGEIENLLCQILNFEKGTRNKKGFLVIEREFSLLILTRFFEIENSRQCLEGAQFSSNPNCLVSIVAIFDTGIRRRQPLSSSVQSQTQTHQTGVSLLSNTLLYSILYL